MTPLSLPMPRGAVKTLLIAVGVVGVAGTICFNWFAEGPRIFGWLECTPDGVLRGEVWRLLTAGLLTHPRSLSHLLFTLMGIYFLCPDLEKRWGTARFVRFWAASTVVGFAASIALDRWGPFRLEAHHAAYFGAGAFIVASAIAWGKENPAQEVRLFFVLPVSGRHFVWVSIGLALLGLVYPFDLPEGPLAPFGGVLAGLVLGGTPSMLRKLTLRIRLTLLRRKQSGLNPLVDSTRRLKGPRGSNPLRIVQGGLRDEPRTIDKKDLN